MVSLLVQCLHTTNFGFSFLTSLLHLQPALPYSAIEKKKNPPKKRIYLPRIEKTPYDSQEFLLALWNYFIFCNGLLRIVEVGKNAGGGRRILGSKCFLVHKNLKIKERWVGSSCMDFLGCYCFSIWQVVVNRPIPWCLQSIGVYRLRALIPVWVFACPIPLVPTHLLYTKLGSTPHKSIHH